MSDPEASQDYTSDVVGVLDSNTSIGQKFVSRRANLNGITLWLTISSGQSSQNTAVPGSISIKLFHAIGETTPTFSTTISTPASGSNFPFTINIPNQKNPAEQPYFLLLSTNSKSIQVNGRNSDAYPLGQAYVNEKLVDADIGFRLSYDYSLVTLIQDTTDFFKGIWIAFPLLILIWLPGWLLLEASGSRSRFDFGEQTALSIGLSLALVPIIMLWTTTLKIRWSRSAVLFVAGILVAILFIRLLYLFISSRKNRLNIKTDQPKTEISHQKSTFNLTATPTILLIIIFLGSLAIRLIMVRDLATPAWVDSVHHALITRLIVNAGGYPSTYLPYLDISPTTYHPGFHSIAATFIWLSDLDISQALLVLGQVLNALSVFSIYLFSNRLIHSSSAALFAAMITGFLTPMPAYYTSWGRYTELTGLLLLPVVLALVQLSLSEKSWKRLVWLILLGAITASGLFMIHYRVIVFVFLLLVSFLIVRFASHIHMQAGERVKVLSTVALLAIVSMIGVLPWLIPMIKNTLIPKINTSLVASVPFFQDFSWPYLTAAFGKQALVLAGLGLIWSLIRQRKLAFIVCLWVLALFFLANLDALKLPGAGLITNISVEIFLFIPISILGGYFLDQLLSSWKNMIPQKFYLVPFAIIIILGVFVSYLGARQLVPILNPITLLSREADLPAIRWVDDNIPEDETIVINPFAWGYGLFAGNDGGYWISPLSGRMTIPPPVLYGLGKNTKPISQQSQEIISRSTDPASLWDYLNSQQIQYIYAGARGGVISPEILSSSGLFSVIYHRDGVWILSLKP